MAGSHAGAAALRATHCTTWVEIVKSLHKFHFELYRLGRLWTLRTQLSAQESNLVLSQAGVSRARPRMGLFNLVPVVQRSSAGTPNLPVEEVDRVGPCRQAGSEAERNQQRLSDRTLVSARPRLADIEIEYRDPSDGSSQTRSSIPRERA
jgi:hypothetical protein